MFEDLPDELDKMIDTYEGDTDEYAKGVIDAWLHLTGREPDRCTVVYPSGRVLRAAHSGAVPPEQWVRCDAVILPGWPDNDEARRLVAERKAELEADARRFFDKMRAGERT